MNKLNNKQPKSLVHPKSDIRQSYNPDSYLSYNPVWQISFIDKDGKWGWKKIGKKRWEEKILPFLEKLESMTWAEIEKASGGKSTGTNHHYILIDKLIKEARMRLQELKILEDQLFSLRIDSKTRIFGVRNTFIFKIIWFDFDHEICPSTKRNT